MVLLQGRIWIAQCLHKHMEGKALLEAPPPQMGKQDEVTACCPRSFQQPANSQCWKDQEPDDNSIPTPADDSGDDSCLLHQ